MHTTGTSPARAAILIVLSLLLTATMALAYGDGGGSGEKDAATSIEDGITQNELSVSFDNASPSTESTNVESFGGSTMLPKRHGRHRPGLSRGRGRGHGPPSGRYGQDPGSPRPRASARPRRPDRRQRRAPGHRQQRPRRGRWEPGRKQRSAASRRTTGRTLSNAPATAATPNAIPNRSKSGPGCRRPFPRLRHS